MTLEAYLQQTAATRPERMRWWHAARFGMFIHWGLYSQLGRHEWVMNRERIPIPEYEKLAATWQPGPAPAREWARLAREAGMQYMVLTTKHHEGFCLWDTQQTGYNAARLGPRRDLVAEYVAACREFGLKVGFYYSLMDWHHPDGALCATDEAARRRFLDFTQGCVRELCTQYGQVDILWYDVSWPLETPERWESLKMNQMVRELQPHIIINNRSQLDEDFGTPEEHVTPEKAGRAWEACMTFNGSWGFMPISPDWRSVREVVGLLNAATAGGGNLLLNIGPAPDGSVPAEALERLSAVGRWLAPNQEAVYGAVDRAAGRMEFMPTGGWSIKGNTAYFWVTRWPGSELVIGGLRAPVVKASLLVTGQPLAVEQTENRLLLRGLPAAQPDAIAGTTLIKLECSAPPQQVLGRGYVVVDKTPPAIVRLAAGADRFGEQRGLGISLIDFKLAGRDSGDLFILENTFHGKGGPARHLHHEQDEFFYCLEGEFVFEIGTARFTLQPGESALGLRQVPHVWAHVGAARGRILITFAPAGKMEAFFREVTQANAMPPQDPALWRAHGMELLGPPLKWE